MEHYSEWILNASRTKFSFFYDRLSWIIWFKSLIITRHKIQHAWETQEERRMEWVNCARVWQESISVGVNQKAAKNLPGFNTSWLISFRSITKRFCVWCHATRCYEFLSSFSDHVPLMKHLLFSCLLSTSQSIYHHRRA